MTNEEFANSPAISGILTKDESLAVMMNISCRDKWPMPSQLSSSRQQRAPYNLNSSSVDNRSSVLRRYTIGIIFNSVKSSNWIPIIIHSLEATPVPFDDRMYCFKWVEGETEVDTPVVNCAVTFTVDRNICIQGIVISSQTRWTLDVLDIWLHNLNLFSPQTEVITEIRLVTTQATRRFFIAIYWIEKIVAWHIFDLWRSFTEKRHNRCLLQSPRLRSAE